MSQPSEDKFFDLGLDACVTAITQFVDEFITANPVPLRVDLHSYVERLRDAMRRRSGAPAHEALAVRYFFDRVAGLDGASVVSTFALTGDEQARVAEAGGMLQRGAWWRLACQMHRYLLKAYHDGEIDLETLLRRTRASSLGCDEVQRSKLLAITVERALQLSPRKRRRSPAATYQRDMVLAMLRIVHDRRPDLPLWPNAAADRFEGTAVEMARQHCEVLGLPAFSVETVRRWWRDSGYSNRTKGRPPRRSS
jgi:hypothetical protein